MMTLAHLIMSLYDMIILVWPLLPLNGSEDFIENIWFLIMFRINRFGFLRLRIMWYRVHMVMVFVYWIGSLDFTDKKFERAKRSPRWFRGHGRKLPGTSTSVALILEFESHGRVVKLWICLHICIFFLRNQLLRAPSVGSRRNSTRVDEGRKRWSFGTIKMLTHEPYWARGWGEILLWRPGSDLRPREKSKKEGWRV